MLKIDHLTIYHKKDNRMIIKDFSLTLQEGDKAVLIGEEGNGKSTLLAMIYDDTLTDSYTEITGEIQRGKQRFGYLPQEMPEKVKKMSVKEYFGEILETGERKKEAALLAAELGILASVFEEEQRMDTFSGGEKVKLQMISLLLAQPDVLLLDEPSNDIDIDTLRWMEHFLKKCRMPVLFVSHDEVLIERTANIVVHMEQKRRKTQPEHTVARMSYQNYVNERTRRIEQQTQNANSEKREYNAKQERLRKIEQKVEHRQETISRKDPAGGRLLKKKMKAVKSMERRYEKEAKDMTQMPEMEEEIFVTFSNGIKIPNGKTVLDFSLPILRVKGNACISENACIKGNACISENAGEGGLIGCNETKILAENIKLRLTGSEKICIIGKNGCGKSTLLEQIYDHVKGKKLKIGYMPQNYEEVLPYDKTPVDFLTDIGTKEEITRIRTYLGSMKYTADEMMHSIAELSGGQKAKLLFLKMSLDACEILLLDEPTRNFSPLSNPVIRKSLHEFPGAVVSISHDRKYIREVSDKVYELTKEGLTELDITQI